jgi:DNA-binding transcriptional ArsR family regulator
MEESYKRMKPKTREELLAECACFDLRKATRAVSRMYDEFLRDRGLNITQFSLLRLIRTEKELSISTLGRYMSMDRTSITRALAPLERDGLIDSRPGADKRIRIVSVTCGLTHVRNVMAFVSKVMVFDKGISWNAAT